MFTSTFSCERPNVLHSILKSKFHLQRAWFSLRIRCKGKICFLSFERAGQSSNQENNYLVYKVCTTSGSNKTSQEHIQLSLVLVLLFKSYCRRTHMFELCFCFYSSKTTTIHKFHFFFIITVQVTENKIQ